MTWRKLDPSDPTTYPESGVRVLLRYRSKERLDGTSWVQIAEWLPPGWVTDTLVEVKPHNAFGWMPLTHENAHRAVIELNSYPECTARDAAARVALDYVRQQGSEEAARAEGTQPAEVAAFVAGKSFARALELTRGEQAHNDLMRFRLSLGVMPPCEAEDQAGYTACYQPATLQTIKRPRRYYCADHRENRHAWRPEAEVEPIAIADGAWHP